MIFQAQKPIERGGSHELLTFDQVDINIGGGFNGSVGVFKVPIGGIYQRSFSGASSRFQTDMAYVGVFRNEILEFLFYDTDQAAGAAGKSIAYTWMMDLVKDDELTLYSFNILASGANPNKIEGPITFTGELIHIVN